MPVTPPTTVAPNLPSVGPGYTFEVSNSSGQPARWNPCEAVHYAVVDTGAPTGWQSDVANDFNQAAQATGLNFVYDGAFSSTSAVPATSKIVINWASALTGGDDVGLTTYWYYNAGGFAPQMTSAQIQLLSSLHSGAGQSGEQPVLLHELGHAIGLGHVNASEVMNPVDMGLTTYQSGDLAGLHQLGAAAGCTNFYK